MSLSLPARPAKSPIASHHIKAFFADDDKPELLQLLDSVLELSILMLQRAKANQAKSVSTTSMEPPTLQRKNSLIAIASKSPEVTPWQDNLGSFEQDLNRVVLWRTDVAEANLESTLVKGSLVYEPVRRAVLRITDIVTAVFPAQYRHSKQVVAIVDRIARIQREVVAQNVDTKFEDGTKFEDTMSGGCRSPEPVKIMITTDTHEIKEAKGQQEILKAMKKSVSDLFGLWNFMELAQANSTCKE